MNYRAALFDLDNTLADTEPLHFEAYESVMREYGIPVTHEDRIRSIGVPAPVNIARLIHEHGRTDLDPEILSAARQARYLELLQMRPVPLMPGAGLLLQLLRDRSIPCIIASSSKRDQIAMTISRSGLDAHFDTFVSFQDVARGKPYPDIYIEAARRLDRRPDECVVFEDAPAGIAAGIAAGCYNIAVKTAYFPDVDFSAADLVVESLAAVNCDLVFGSAH